MATPVLGAVWGPTTAAHDASAGGDLTFAFNGATDTISLTFQAPKTGQIDQFGLYVSSVSGGGRTLEALISEVDASGAPTGVAAGGGSPYTLDCTSSGWKTGSGGSAFSVTKGQTYALLIRDKGPGAGTANIRDGFSSSGSSGSRDSMSVEENGSVDGTIAFPRIWCAYSDGEAPTLYTGGFASSSFLPTSNPDERGALFTCPANMTISGIIVHLDPPAGGSATVRFFDSDGVTVLWSKTVGGEYSSTRRQWYFPFDSNITLSEGAQYRITVEAISGVTQIWQYETDSQAARESQGLAVAEDWQRTTRNNHGAWTDDPAGDVLLAGLVIASLNLATPPSCSGVSVSYGAGTRTGPNNTPWTVSFLAADGDNPVTNAEIWTGPGRTGTQVASGSASSSAPNSLDVAYNAPGLADGDQTLYLSVDDGLGNVSGDCAFTVRRDDVEPTDATGVTVGAP